MPELTITEALAELKVIEKKIASKHRTIMEHCLHQTVVRDQFENQGGTPEYLSREAQAIRDLTERRIAIRTGIQHVNTQVEVNIEGKTRTVAQWLVWKREVAPEAVSRLRQVLAQVKTNRDECMKKGMTVGDAASDSQIIVCVNEPAIREELENIETMLERLDGKLSLVNARHTLEV